MAQLERNPVTTVLSPRRLSLRSLLVLSLLWVGTLITDHSAIAAVDKITTATQIALRTASRPLPESTLLDIGIARLQDGLELTDEDDAVFPEIRFAEAVYFANQLAKVLEKSGGWGAVRVIPNSDIVVDLYVTGTILHSDGETLALRIQVTDSSGRQWFAEEYRQTVGKYAYDQRLRSLGDPFQNLFVSIANAMLDYREKLSDQQAQRLRQLSELRFAKLFSPEAFNSYVKEKANGTLTLERLPATDDSLLQRVEKIRQRDYLYIDSMQDYYDEFSQRMHFPYQDFRRSSFDSVVKARQLKKQGNRQLIAGVGAVLAGIYGRSQAETAAVSDASTITAISGGYLVKSGLNKKQQAATYTEAVAEMGSSLEAEIAPRVIALEDQTITLSGSVQAQYQQWQQLLQQIFQQERGDL